MKKALFLFTAFVTTIFAENCRSDTTQSIYSDHPNRIYIGPDVLCFPKNRYIRESWGIRLGYEYLKPDSMYSALDFLSSCPGGNYDWYYVLNTRLGYTVATANTMVTPFVGGLIVDPFIMRFLTGGFRSLISINSRTDFGCNLTFFMPLQHGSSWSEEVAFPLIYHPTTHCDLHFEVFYSELLKWKLPSYGSRFQVGYRY